MNEKLRSTIIETLRKTENGLSRIQLVKLCFLADYFAAEKLGRTITGVCYSIYYYGPYSPEIIDTAREMEEEGYLVRHTKISRTTGELYYIYCLNESHTQDTCNLEEKEKAIISDIVKKYGSIPIKELLDTVYSLSAVKNARLGEEIPLLGSMRHYNEEDFANFKYIPANNHRL